MCFFVCVLLNTYDTQALKCVIFKQTHKVSVVWLSQQTVGNRNERRYLRFRSLKIRSPSLQSPPFFNSNVFSSCVQYSQINSLCVRHSPITVLGVLYLVKMATLSKFPTGPPEGCCFRSVSKIKVTNHCSLMEWGKQ